MCTKMNKWTVIEKIKDIDNIYKSEQLGTNAEEDRLHYRRI